jgi:hypothetical protein
MVLSQCTSLACQSSSFDRIFGQEVSGYLFQRHFEDAFQHFEWDGGVAGKAGFDCLTNIGVKLEAGGFGIQDANASFVHGLLADVFLLFTGFVLPLSLLRFEPNFLFALFGS